MVEFINLAPLFHNFSSIARKSSSGDAVPHAQEMMNDKYMMTDT